MYFFMSGKSKDRPSHLASDCLLYQILCVCQGGGVFLLLFMTFQDHKLQIEDFFYLQKITKPSLSLFSIVSVSYWRTHWPWINGNYTRKKTNHLHNTAIRLSIIKLNNNNNNTANSDNNKNHWHCLALFLVLHCIFDCSACPSLVLLVHTEWLDSCSPRLCCIQHAGWSDYAFSQFGISISSDLLVFFMVRAACVSERQC